MKASYLNNLTSSFFLWMDHEILSKGDAFTNYSGKLYKSNDPYFENKSSVYSSPFKQWVYDSSISQAVIPSGIYYNGQFLPRQSNGLNIDFNHGRVIFANNLIPDNQNLTANYSFKDFNIYYTDEKEETLLFEKSYSLTPKFTTITGGLGYADNPYPCIFFKLKTNENTPFAFGGLDTTENWIRCIILARDVFSLDSLMSILNDSVRKVFPVFSPENLPFNYMGDFKTGITSYNYRQMCQSNNQANLVFIKKVTCVKFDEINNLYINKKTLAATVDFELESVRTPRV